MQINTGMIFIHFRVILVLKYKKIKELIDRLVLHNKTVVSNLTASRKCSIPFYNTMVTTYYFIDNSGKAFIILGFHTGDK